MASPRLQCGKGLPVWHGRKNIGGSQKNAWRWRARPRASACEPRFYKWRRSGFGREYFWQPEKLLRACTEGKMEIRAFTSRLPTGRSSFPLPDITTTATGLLCWRDPLETAD